MFLQVLRICGVCFQNPVSVLVLSSGGLHRFVLVKVNIRLSDANMTALLDREADSADAANNKAFTRFKNICMHI